MAELGLNELILDHLKKLPPFEFKTNGDFEGELEWRPTHKRRILAGDLIYQGQWVKGTMIKQGFGRRVHINLNASQYNPTDQWFDQGFFAKGKLNGQARAVYWYGGKSCESYEGTVQNDRRQGQGTYTFEDGSTKTQEWKEGEKNDGEKQAEEAK